MSSVRDWPSAFHTISEIAEFVRDSEHNIQEFIREDRIPYMSFPDGILIPLGGFQSCMPGLYDLEAGLRSIHEAVEKAGPACTCGLVSWHRAHAPDCERGQWLDQVFED